jgi:hypothetical protein
MGWVRDELVTCYVGNVSTTACRIRLKTWKLNLNKAPENISPERVTRV